MCDWHVLWSKLQTKKLFWCPIPQMTPVKFIISDVGSLLSSYPSSSSHGEVALENAFTLSCLWLEKVFSFSYQSGFAYIYELYIFSCYLPELGQRFFLICPWWVREEYGEVSFPFVAVNRNFGNHSYCSSSEPTRYSHFNLDIYIFVYASSSPSYYHFCSWS